MKVLIPLIIGICICFPSCKGDNQNNVITYTLKRSDFEEKINVTGTIQPISVMSVACPRNSYGEMIVSTIAEDGSFVKKGDTLCILSAPELERSYNDLLKSNEKLEAELKRTVAEINLKNANLRSQLESNEKQLNIALLDSLNLQFVPKYQKDLILLDIKRVKIEKEKIEKKLGNAIKIGESEIRQKKARIIQENTRAQSLADQLKSMTIIAQRDGLVSRLESPQIRVMGSSGTGSFGGQIREGSILIINVPLLNFPDLSKMQVSADVNEADFKRIEKGQKVNICVDAAEKLTTTGVVNRKSLAASVNQRSSGSKVRTYEVIIDVDSCHSEMKPGLSTTCEIIIREEKDTIFVPSLAIFKKDSAEIIYVKNKREFIPVKIESGPSGDSYTIISSGLKGDEIIALTEPPEKLVTH